MAEDANDQEPATIESTDLVDDIAQLARFGFRLELISPADDPTMAVVSGHGIELRLRHAQRGATVDAASRSASQVLVTKRADDGFCLGRAGMTYRDLLPGRLGGRFIASRIRIDDGGDVDDYVHFHDIEFQIIFCVAGWVEVVYEDQGPPFRMRPGDCVLQPPGIRHRVLESSPGLEVLEIGSPASHDTRVDHDMMLPTSGVEASRLFSGQRFVRHVALDAPWLPWRHRGFECRDTGIADASHGAGGVVAIRPADATEFNQAAHEVELMFWLIVSGSTSMIVDGHCHALAAGDALSLPPGSPFALQACSSDLEMLEVTSPAFG